MLYTSTRKAKIQETINTKFLIRQQNHRNPHMLLVGVKLSPSGKWNASDKTISCVFGNSESLQLKTRDNPEVHQHYNYCKVVIYTAKGYETVREMTTLLATKRINLTEEKDNGQKWRETPRSECSKI